MGFPGAGGVKLIKELEYVLIKNVGHLGFRIKSFSIYVFDSRFLLPHPILKSQRTMEVPFQLQFLPLPISFFSSCWKDSGSIGNDSSGLAGSGPKGKRIAQGYKT